MIAAVHDHPFRLEACREIDVGPQICIGGIAQEGRDFSNVDGGQGMKPQMQAVVRAGFGDAHAGLIIETLHGIGRDVRLGVEIVDAMFGRPGDAILERNAAAKVDTDPVLEGHGIDRLATSMSATVRFKVTTRNRQPDGVRHELR